MSQVSSPKLQANSSLPFLPLFLLVFIFYLNFVSRIIMAPLLPVIETDLGLGHGQAGAFFFFIASGYGLGLLGSGVVSAWLTHRLTIACAGMLGGAALIMISTSTSIAGIHGGLVIIGIFAGFYLPSGIATLTETIRREHWGKAMAIHEMAPNLAFITTPLLSEGLLRLFSWRGALAALGACAIFMPVLFLMFGRGSRNRGEPPRFTSMREVMTESSCWLMAAFFTISIGASYGVYTMMPLFLVSEINMDRLWANALIGLSRTFGILVLFLSGVFIDRMGPKKAMTVYLIATGILTFLLGFVRGAVAIPALVFFQAASVVCLFPVGFTIVSLLFPDHLRGIAISLVIFIGFLIGGGIVPPAIGYWAERFSFSSGFALLGVFFLALFPLFLRSAHRLKITD
jgi:NNP family nitrate/nitrite transporter-like MFS transporter